MSQLELMTIREFRSKYRIEENTELTHAARELRRNGWNGLKVPVRFSPSGAYAYPESTLKKIARALNIQLFRGKPKPMMTLQEFRGIVPGLSRVFSRVVAEYCNARGIKGEGEYPRLYPYGALKLLAENEGKEVPELEAPSPEKEENNAQNSTCITKRTLEASRDKALLMPLSGTTENSDAIVSPDEVDAGFDGVDAVRCLRYIAASCEGMQQ